MSMLLDAASPHRVVPARGAASYGQASVKIPARAKPGTSWMLPALGNWSLTCAWFAGWSYWEVAAKFDGIICLKLKVSMGPV